MKNKSTQELFGATSEGLSAKSSYATPTIKVVTFQVEHGFAGSETQPPESGMTFYLGSPSQLNQTSASSSWQTENGTWF